MIIPELERPRITEIQVRIDCNGCVQKIKRALNGINGIYDFYIDIPQQKITVIGWSDPERIIKAIKKVRKIATICSHTEASDPNCQPTQTPTDGGAPPQEAGAQGSGSENGPPVEPQSSETAPPPGPSSQEPPNYQPPPAQPHENPTDQNPPPPEQNHQPQVADAQPTQPPNGHRYEEEARVVYHHPHHYGNQYGYSNAYGPGYSHSSGEPWGSHPGPSYRYEPTHQPVYQDPPPSIVYHEPQHPSVYHKTPSQPVYHEPPPQAVYSEPPPQPVQVNHSYNRYQPSPNITQYQYIGSPPPYPIYGKMDHYYVDSYQNGSNSNGNVTSMFSDENPNACTIV